MPSDFWLFWQKFCFKKVHRSDNSLLQAKSSNKKNFCHYDLKEKSCFLMILRHLSFKKNWWQTPNSNPICLMIKRKSSSIFTVFFSYFLQASLHLKSSFLNLCKSHILITPSAAKKKAPKAGKLVSTRDSKWVTKKLKFSLWIAITSHSS